MHRASIAIVGGGLSGLYAAHLLEQQGLHDYVLLEARPTWGGRIESATLDEPQHPHRFDLGPTWYWPDFQPQLDALIQQLGLTAFEQHEAGDMMVEWSASLPPSRYEGYRSAPTSVRLLGGMAALVDALRKTLDPKRLRPNQQVRQLAGDGERITLEALDPQQGVHNYSVEHVLLALPPRLAVATLRFTPTLPSALSSAWAHTTTWMAPHAKYVAVYDTPFWRDHGLSGEARSTLGPMGEMHDASAPGGQAALFGFLGLPAAVRHLQPEATLKAHCRAQLVRLFGPKAAEPRAEFFKDWAHDRWTATDADRTESSQHGTAPPFMPATGPWQHRLIGVASEWSPQYPGYVAGAIEAAARGVQALRRSRNTQGRAELGT